MKRILSVACGLLALVGFGLAGGLGAGTCSAAVKLKVGASPTPHAEILKEAAPLLKEKGIELVIVEYADYVQPNVALNNGDLDANYFQHKPYMDDFNKQKGTKLTAMAFIHYEPFGMYAGKTSSLKDLKKGAIVSVPNDTTNEARALLLLKDQGLIKLKKETLDVTRLDIVENPMALKIEEIEAPQLARSLPDVDFSIINGNYAMLGKLKVKDAVATEANDSLAAATFANVIAVREGDEKRPELKALVEILKSDALKKFMIEKFEGGVVPAK